MILEFNYFVRHLNDTLFEGSYADLFSKIQNNAYEYV